MHNRPKATVFMNAIQITNCTLTEIATRRSATANGKHRECTPRTTRRPTPRSLGTCYLNRHRCHQHPNTSDPHPKTVPVRKYIETNGNLSQDMTLTEAENWLKGFTAWFKWNALILDNKCPVTKAALLENFLDERMQTTRLRQEHQSQGTEDN